MLLHFNSVGMIMWALSMNAVHVLPWKKSAYLFDFSGYIVYDGFFHIAYWNYFMKHPFFNVWYSIGLSDWFFKIEIQQKSEK